MGALRRESPVPDTYDRIMTRRLATVPGLYLGGLLLVALIPVWLPIAAIFDVIRRQWRMPTVRLLSFAVAWLWLEICGVTASFVFWLVGQRRNTDLHYALQRWWAKNLLGSLGILCGIRVTVDNVEALKSGPVLLFSRHASLADSLVSAYVVGHLARMKPRYVLKKELLVDPCLDIVGNRLPNHFLDRTAPDSRSELQALETLVAGLGTEGVGIIFPEGTRANPAKRTKALEKISSNDPERSERLANIQHLLPPRPSGAAAMIRGNATADVVISWHVGFEGLDTFGGIHAALARPMPPVHVVFQRFARSTVPAADAEANGAFTKWLDERWIEIDSEVDRTLKDRESTTRSSHG